MLLVLIGSMQHVKLLMFIFIQIVVVEKEFSSGSYSCL